MPDNGEPWRTQNPKTVAQADAWIRVLADKIAQINVQLGTAQYFYELPVEDQQRHGSEEAFRTWRRLAIRAKVRRERFLRRIKAWKKRASFLLTETLDGRAPIALDDVPDKVRLLFEGRAVILRILPHIPFDTPERAAARDYLTRVSEFLRARWPSPLPADEEAAFDPATT